MSRAAPASDPPAPTGIDATLVAGGSAAARTGAADLADDDTLVAGADAPVHAPADEAPPERLGRYLILERLGAGGMGVVFVAYDPELDRKVAVKVIRGRADEEARARLLREAQAMAKLSHPNVVAVHDVGVVEGQLFLAMELVRGQSLGAWLRAGPRGWREVLARFLPAGRGLAAAHEVGIIHRDFKPDNVLLDAEGRAKVTDFGLARAAADGPEVAASAAPRDELARADATSGVLSAPLTQAGAVVGTPAYMAREQHLGQPADARTDQFSFCASLYQALYGQLPFAGRTLLALVDNVLSGRVQDPPRGRKIPGFVHRAVLRGLAADPAQRFPSMHALLAALDRDPARTRRRALTAGLMLALGAGASAAVLAGPDPCSGAAERLVGAWDPARAAAVEDALRASGLTYAEETWSKVREQIDLYAQAWSERHEETCRAHRRGEVSDELLDLAMDCLAGRRERLAALTGVLAAADPAVVERAVQAATSLPPLARCADPRALRTGVPPPPPEDEAGVTAVRAALARAAAEQDAGRYAAAGAVAEAALTDARALGYRPLIAEALLRRGSLARRAGDPTAADPLLREAWHAGLASRHDEVAGEAALEQIIVVGRERADLSAGRRWAADAEALLERAGSGDVARAQLENNLGDMYLRAGLLEPAVTALGRAVDLRAAALGPRDPSVARARTSLGEALRRQGRLAEAAAAHEQALRDTIDAYGPSHPMVGVARNNLGITYSWLGRRADAVAEHEAAVALRIRALGPGHPQVASSLTNLATELVELGRLGDAEAQLRRAIEILSAHPGAGGPDLANARSNLGNVYFAEGRLDEALEAYRGALTLDAAQFGEDSLDASIARNNVGTALWRLGRRDEAEAELRRALAALEAAAGPAHPHVAFPLLGLGGVRLDAGAPAEAALHLARARDLAQGQDDPGLRAAIRAELAAARGRAGQLARPEVLAELQAALTDLRAAGPLFGFSRERAEAALRAPE